MKTETRPRYDKGQLLWPVTGGSIPMPVYLYKGLRRKGWRIKVVGTAREHGDVLAFSQDKSDYGLGIGWLLYTNPPAPPRSSTCGALRCLPEDAPLMLATWGASNAPLATDILTIKINQGLPT